jgi:hypothetical protein
MILRVELGGTRCQVLFSINAWYSSSIAWRQRESSKGREESQAQICREQESIKGVFGRLGELRYSHLNLAQPPICCLLGRVCPSQAPQTPTPTSSSPHFPHLHLFLFSFPPPPPTSGAPSRQSELAGIPETSKTTPLRALEEEDEASGDEGEDPDGSQDDRRHRLPGRPQPPPPWTTARHRLPGRPPATASQDDRHRSPTAIPATASKDDRRRCPHGLPPPRICSHRGDERWGPDCFSIFCLRVFV